VGVTCWGRRGVLRWRETPGSGGWGFFVERAPLAARDLTEVLLDHPTTALSSDYSDLVSLVPLLTLNCWTSCTG